MTAAPPDWYPDPSGSGGLRYWDGQQWTSHLAPGPSPTPYGAVPGQAAQGHLAAPAFASARVATTPDGQRLAGWWHRVGAALLDNLFVGILCLPFTITAQVSMQDRLSSLGSELQRRVDANDTGAFSWYFRELAHLFQQHAWQYAAPAAVAFVVTTVCLRLWGGTPGKLATGLRVRLRERPGNLSWGRAAARALLFPALSSLIVLLAFATGTPVAIALVMLLGAAWSLADPLWAAADGKRQTLHDKVVGTNVVRLR